MSTPPQHTRQDIREAIDAAAVMRGGTEQLALAEDDPVTLGVLLQLVREAHSQPRAHLSWDAGWFVRQGRDCFDWDEEIGDPDGGPHRNNRYRTEFAALSAALRAAP